MFFGEWVEDIPFVGNKPVVSYAAKKSGAYDKTTPPQYAWLHRVMTIAKMMDAPLYSEASLRQNVANIRSHLLDKDDLIQIPAILRSSGVRFVVVEALPSAKIDGVCVWIHGQPAIGMTTLRDRLDNFAFVLRHEIEHVLRGDGKDVSYSPVDEIGFDYDPESSDFPEERIANKEAAEFCVPRHHLESFIARKGQFISERDVLAFAARLEIHPAIVIGQIQRRTNNYAWLRKYQNSIRPYLFDWKFIDGMGLHDPHRPLEGDTWQTLKNKC